MLPITELQTRRIRANWQALTELIDIDDRYLLSLMRAARCITDRQYQSIVTTERLLDIVSRKSCAHYDAFVDCLTKSNQKQVADLLSQNAGCHNYKYKYITRITCETKSGVGETRAIIHNRSDIEF